MFKFKDKTSEDMKIVIEEQTALITKASQKYETINVDGRDGGIFRPLGYSTVAISLDLQITDITKIDEILSWLNGEGELEYQGRKTKARIYNTINPQRAVLIRIAKVEIIRDPFWYKIDDDYIVVTTEIINEGNVYARPLIKLEKGTVENVEIKINDVIFNYDFNGENEVFIDCENMNAYVDGFVRNNNLEIGFRLPVLEPGVNSIEQLQGDATIKVKRKDVWL